MSASPTRAGPSQRVSPGGDGVSRRSRPGAWPSQRAGGRAGSAVPRPPATRAPCGSCSCWRSILPAWDGQDRVSRGARWQPGAAPEIIEPVPVSSAPSEFGDDAQGERVAANTGEVLTEQVGGSTVIAGGRRADHFDVMTFPVHLATADDARGRFGEGVEIGDCEPERRIGRDRVTERRYRLRTRPRPAALGDRRRRPGCSP